MFSFEDVYLPSYLSDDKRDALRLELKQFPDNMRYFRAEPLKSPLQGDVFDKRPYIICDGDRLNFRDTRLMIISNSCDIAIENARDSPVTVLVAPVGPLAALERVFLKGRLTADRITSRVASIRKQEISNLFFLPAGHGIEQESVVYLDRIQSLPRELLKLTTGRLCMLSQYGFYLMLIKLSYHLCRAKEGVER